MRFRHIEVFHAVYSCGSLTKAAEVLNVSQPSVSKVLQHAEIQLGYKLFDRKKGRLIPTDRANQLFQDVDALHEQVTTVRRTALNLRNEAIGKIRVASTPAFAFGPLPDLIRQFRDEFPEVSFAVQTNHFSSLIREVIEHRVEFAVGFGKPSDPRLKSIILGKALVKLLVPPGVGELQTAGVSKSVLKSQPFISITESGPLGILIKRYLEKHDIQFTTVISVQTYYLAAKMVEKGLGLSFLDEFSASTLNSDSGVNVLELDPPLKFPIYCFFHEDKPTKGINRTFIDRICTWGKEHLH